MKLSKILMFAALFALTACGGGAAKGQEVEAKKAKEVANNIATTSKDVKTVEFSMEMTDYDAEEKKTSNSTYTYKLAENGDIYCATYGSGVNSDGKPSSSSTALHVVKNDKYDEVFCFTSKSSSSTEDTMMVYGKKGNETIYATMTASIGAATITMTQTMYLSFTSPAELIDEAEAEKLSGYDVKYYSSGDKNLTIDIKVSRETKVSEEDDTKTVTASYVYNNGLFSSFEMSAEYFSGDKMDQKCSAKYSGVKIPDLPDGWESKINQSLLGL